MTYKLIQEIYRFQYQKTIKTCWIADVKREMGFEMRDAPNRQNAEKIKNCCKDQIVRKRIMDIINKLK